MISCKYCGQKMELAWPATQDGSKGAIMSCDRGAGGCGATCQSDGRKTWDWKSGDRKEAQR